MKFNTFLTNMGEVTMEHLIADTRAHLPKDEKFKYWADRRLQELCVALERLMPFGAIQSERQQPAEMWIHVFRENGKRRVAYSFDGPPSPAYVRLVKG